VGVDLHLERVDADAYPPTEPALRPGLEVQLDIVERHDLAPEVPHKPTRQRGKSLPWHRARNRMFVPDHAITVEPQLADAPARGSVPNVLDAHP